MDGVLWQTCSSPELFREFGPSRYFPGQAPLEVLDVAAEPREMRQRLRAVCPTSPGVYGMVDHDGQLIYVGMSARLCDRLLTYFSAGAERAKEPRIASQARRVVWESHAHEFTVQLRELELIRRWRPRCNRRGRLEGERGGYLCLTTDEAPHFQAARKPPRGARRCWGPLRMGRRLQASIDRLNHVFRLRDCTRAIPVRFADQRTLFQEDWQVGCLRGSLMSCSAPCAAGCSRREYYEQIARATAFLDGEDRQVLEQLEAAMREASARHEYERAISQRDAFQELTYLVDRLQLLREVVRDYWFVYPLSAPGSRTLWNLIAGGEVVGVAREPATRRERETLAALLEQTYLERDRQALVPFEQFEPVRLVASWFRNRPEELGKRLLSADALAWCRRRSPRTAK